MTFLIFIDVMQRTFSRPVGKMAKFLLWLLSGDLNSELGQTIANSIGPGLFWGLAWFAIAAVQSARFMRAPKKENRDEPQVNMGQSFLFGTLLVAAFFGFLKVLLWVFPSECSRSAEICAWFYDVGRLLGATMATHTRRHIVVDAVKS